MSLFDNVDEICIDIDCEFIMIDRQFLISKKSNYVVYVMKINSLKINDIESISLFISKKIALNFTIFNKIDDELIKICFIRYVYIVDDLKIKLFINNDIFESKNMIFYVNKNKLIIKSCDNFITSLHVTYKKNERVKRTIRSLTIIIILFYSCGAVLMKYKNEKFSHNRDFIFNFYDVDRFDVEKEMFFHIVNVNFCFVQIRNITNKSIFIIKSERLNILMKYEKKNCYLINSKIRHLIVKSWKKKALKLKVATLVVFHKVINAIVFVVDNDNSTISIFTIFTTQIVVFNLSLSLITSNIEQKYVLSFDIIIYDISQVVEVIVEIINVFFSPWQNDEFMVKLLSKKWMFIILQSNAKLLSSKVYSMSQKNQKFINKKFDKLQTQNKLKYINQFISYNYSIFVVWRIVHKSNEFSKRKSRVVVNIKNLNKAIISNTYLMSFQANVIVFVVNCFYIFVFDAINFFYQWLIRIIDRHKLTIMSHKN